MAKSISELKIKIGADSSELKKELNETQRAMQTALNTKPMESATAALAGVSKASFRAWRLPLPELLGLRVSSTARCKRETISTSCPTV